MVLLLILQYVYMHSLRGGFLALRRSKAQIVKFRIQLCVGIISSLITQEPWRSSAVVPRKKYSAALHSTYQLNVQTSSPHLPTSYCTTSTSPPLRTLTPNNPTQPPQNIPRPNRLLTLQRPPLPLLQNPRHAAQHIPTDSFRLVQLGIERADARDERVEVGFEGRACGVETGADGGG